jgi:molybdopterin/thiamine biosynthesis adenylyltransferase
MASLTDEQAERYSRQIVIPEIGPGGQARLREARVLIVGAGGLGSAIAYYLAAAGIGRIRVVDPDAVELSNLQRQILHDTDRIGMPKVDSAKERLERLNTDVQVEAHHAALTEENGAGLLAQCELALDGTDNYPARYLINELCAQAGKPYVHGSVFRFEGQASVFDARRGPCYRCLYPAPPTLCEFPGPAEAGVLGTTPGVIGCVQATEAIKLILGVGEPLIGRLLVYDGLHMTFDEMSIAKDPACRTCGG